MVDVEPAKTQPAIPSIKSLWIFGIISILLLAAACVYISIGFDQVKSDCSNTASLLKEKEINETWAQGYQTGVSYASSLFNNNLNAAIATAQVNVIKNLCQRTPKPLANEQVTVDGKPISLCLFAAGQ